MKKKYDVELVIWKDALSDNGWKHISDSEPPSECISIGLLVRESPDDLVLAGTWGEDSDGIETNSRITIPKGWIVSRKKIRA